MMTNRYRNESIVGKAQEYFTTIADLVIAFAIVAHTHLAVMYYHVYVTGTKLTIHRSESPREKAFTSEMLFRL